MDIGRNWFGRICKNIEGDANIGDARKQTALFAATWAGEL